MLWQISLIIIKTMTRSRNTRNSVFLCRRPESQAGKMIDLPNHIHICADCMQKSFDTMNTQMNNGNYSDFFNMPNVSMIDLGIPESRKPGEED